MPYTNRMSRRRAITGLAAAAATAAGCTKAAPLAGDTRVLFLVGDIHHGAVLQEHAWREALADTGWRLRFAQTTLAITPEELAATDLFVVCRYAGGDDLGHSPDRLIASRGPRGAFPNTELTAQLAENVRTRGMGIIATHSSIYTADAPDWLALLGVEKPFMHGPIVPVMIHSLNQEHPITRGLSDFDTMPDEAFNAVMLPKPYTPLFKVRQVEPPLDIVCGWARDEGAGRVVVLLPGHNSSPYLRGAYRTIMYRSACWTMGREIPEPDMIFPDGLKCGDDPRTSDIL